MRSLRSAVAKLKRIRRRLLGRPETALAPGAPGAPPELYTFSPDAREVSITTPEPPHPFQNILFNNSYYTIINHTARGQGRHMTTAPEGFINNVIDGERLLYVRDDDSGAYFSVGWEPCFGPLDAYVCRQGQNFIEIENTTGGLRVTWRIWVPAGDDPVELWDVRAVDLAGRARRLSLFTCVGMKCDGMDLYCGDLYRLAAYDPDLAGVYVKTDAELHTTIDFPWHNGFHAASRPPEGWDASPGGFLGARRTLANPRAVEEGASGRSRQAMWAPIGSLHLRLNLAAGTAGAPGESNELRFITGACASPAMARALREKYRHGSLAADPHFAALQAEEQRLSANIALDTPEPSVNRMLNAWVKKQIRYGAYWGRWGWRGYRDTVQQSLGVLTQDPALARANILEACRYQYQDGFALRGWRPVDTKRYADSAQWLIATVTEYLKETGDFSLLAAPAAYFDGGAGSVRQHLERTMGRLHEDRGRHGLCLAHGGDWNDSLTGVGRAGRGESVWLSMAFCRDALLLRELYEYLGEPAAADQMARRHAEMVEAINRHAWDGEWYLCALDDEGRPVGSAQNAEGKIFLNMQSWAQLGRVADPGRWAKAWAATERHLDTGWGHMLNWPCYTVPQPSIGRMTYVRPGAAENGSVYTHGSAFLFLALLERGLADRALKLWRDIEPANPNRPTRCQPNVFFNGFYGPDSEILPGLADHSWMTGSCAWMYFCVVEHLLGLRRGYGGITLRPTLPSTWPEARITRTYRGTTYRVTILNPGAREAAPIESITLNTHPHPPERPLPIDGGTHEVIVRLKK